MTEWSQDAKDYVNARNRVETRRRRGLSPQEARLPEVEAMLDRKMTQANISRALHVGERTIRTDVQVLRDAKKRIVVYEGPRQLQELDPVHRAMLEDTEEAFCAFYEFAVGKKIPSYWLRTDLTEDGKSLLGLLLGPEDTMVNIPPRHAKSTVIAVYCAWRICRDRNIHIIWGSKTEQAAKKWGREVGNRFLGRGGKLAKAYGEFRPEVAGEDVWMPLSGRFRVIGPESDSTVSEYTLQIRGLGQQILGSECDVLILDDPTDKETADSEVGSEREMETIRGDFFSRLMPEGKVFCVGQRVAEPDVFTRLLTDEDPDVPQNWVHINMPAVLDEEEKTVLWPESKWTYAELRKTRGRVGRRQWFAMYQQQPELSEDVIFNMDDVLKARDQERKLGEGMPIDRLFATVVSVDPAFKLQGAVVIADVEYDIMRRSFECWVRDIWELERGQARRKEAMISAVLQYRPDFLVYEDVGVTQDLGEETWFQDLKRLTRIVPHRTTGASKGDPEAGAESLALDFEQGNISTPYQDLDGQKATALLEQDCDVYPRGQGNALMALWFIKWNRKMFVPRGALPTRQNRPGGYQGWGHRTRVVEAAV
jgi:hypothetical protein